MEWMAYSALEPFGFDIENYRAGLPAAMIANSHRKDHASPVVSPLDFFNTGTKREVPQESPEEIARNIKAQVFKMRG